MDYQYISKLQRGCAFTPCYLKGTGKATKIYFNEGGFEYVGRSVKKVLEDYCAINMRSIQSITKVCQGITGKKSIIPLYIKENTLLIPVKTLRPFCRGDKSIGYVNIKEVEKIDFVSNSIKLKNGEAIEYLETIATIKKRMAECMLIEQANLDN